MQASDARESCSSGNETVFVIRAHPQRLRVDVDRRLPVASTTARKHRRKHEVKSIPHPLKVRMNNSLKDVARNTQLSP